MSLILNGTNGLSEVDGSAATPALRGTDANTGIFFPAADRIGISTNGLQRVEVDTNGNVGINTTSPGTYGRFSVVHSGSTIAAVEADNSGLTVSMFQLYNSAGTSVGRLMHYGPAYTGGSVFDAGANSTVLLQEANAPLAIGTYAVAQPIIFGTNVNERMRINSAGQITAPFQPAFFARGNSIVTATDGYVLALNTAVTNRGSHYNTSTFRFTAPVTGVYLLTARITWASAGTGSVPFICINGGAAGGNSANTEMFGYAPSGVLGGYNTTSSATMLVSMNANDFADVRTTVYNSSSQNIDLTRCSFSGFLLG